MRFNQRQQSLKEERAEESVYFLLLSAMDFFFFFYNKSVVGRKEYNFVVIKYIFGILTFRNKNVGML